MTIELGILIGIFVLLFIIILLLISVLKGFEAVMNQQTDIFKKQGEWIDNILDVLYNEDEVKPNMIIDEEDDEPITDAMMNEGLRKLDDLLEQKTE